MRRLLITPTLLFLILLQMAVFSQVPQSITYQGYLTDDTGEPVPDGIYSISAKIYDVETGGSPIWQPPPLTLTTVTVKNGVFSLVMGSESDPLDLPFDKQYWIGIKVGGDPELSPRLRLTTSAYSFNSLNSEKVDGYQVSSVPEANKLLPLNSQAEFDETAIPQKVKMDQRKVYGSFVVTGNTSKELASITITEENRFDVRLTANFVVNINGDGDGFWYIFYIRKNDISGEVLATAEWSPGATSSGGNKTTLSMTCMDFSETGSVTYYLTGLKFDASIKDCLVTNVNLNATWVIE